MTTQKPDPGATVETIFWQLHDGNISEREHYMVRSTSTIFGQINPGFSIARSSVR